jgi:WD40 repeat protein
VVEAGRVARIGSRGVAAWELASAATWTWEAPEIVGGTLTPDGQTLIAVDAQGFLHVLDARGHLRQRFRTSEQIIKGVAAHADGRRAATCDGQGTIAVWELATGRKLAERRIGGVNTIGFSAQGDALFAIDKVSISRGKATAWLLSADLSRAHRLDHDAGVSHAAFAPDGALLVTLGMDGVARVWDRGGVGEATLLHDGPLWTAAWTPDGRKLATGGNAGKVTVWERASWTIGRTLDAHINFVTALAFDAAGALLASAGGDGNVAIWDTDRFLQLARIPTKSLVEHLAFSGDQLLVSGPLTSQSWRCDLYWDTTSARPPAR